MQCDMVAYHSITSTMCVGHAAMADLGTGHIFGSQMQTDSFSSFSRLRLLSSFAASARCHQTVAFTGVEWGWVMGEVERGRCYDIMTRWHPKVNREVQLLVAVAIPKVVSFVSSILARRRLSALSLAFRSLP